jgi:hypothetical protein
LLAGCSLGQVAFEQFLERGRLGLGARDEHTLVHLDLDGACPLLGLGTGLEGFGLQRLVLLPDLCLPLRGTAFAKGRHCHTSLANECDNAVTNNQSESNSRDDMVFN